MDFDYLKILAERTPERSGVKSSYIKKCISFGSTRKGLSYEDASIDGQMQHSEMPSMSILSQGGDVSSAMSGIFEMDNNTLTNASNINTSIVSAKDDFRNSYRGEFDTTLFTDVDLGINFSDSLFEEFLEFFLSYSAEHEAYSLLLNYEALCCKGIEAVSKALTKITSTDAKLQKMFSMLQFLQLERNTWRLIRILFQDRLDPDRSDDDTLIDSLKLSEKQIVDTLYRRNAYIRQSQLIVDWLEKNAEEDLKHGSSDKFEFFTDQCLALEHSLNDLVTMNVKKNSMNVEMDPDAMFKSDNHAIHEADRENECRLFKFMFICIRAGKLDEAQILAEKFGEFWLSAALEGWRLFHDPNYEDELMEGEALSPTEGNKYRDLWKSSTWVASQAPEVPVFEQAVYGSLCGNVRAVLAVCKTWEDVLWSYTKTSLDKLIEREIRDMSQPDRPLTELPLEYWDKIPDIDEIFQELEASDSSEVKSGCKSPHHIIQKYIILDDLAGLIEEMFSWLRNQTVDGHVLRCMAHVILFLRVVGCSVKEELCVPILEAYVQELIKSHKISLVAPYTSTLPKEQQIMWYSKFLEGITDNDERQKCLQYAEDAGLDVPQITKTVVKNIREKDDFRTDISTELAAVTTEDDFQKIHAIDWLMFSPNQRSEAVKQANALLRLFIAQRKIEAAKLLFTKIPQDSVAIIMQMSKAKDLDELSADDDNTTREYLCFKAYLEAMEAFNNWFHQSIHAEPKEPAAPPGEHTTFKQKVAHEHQLQQYQKDVDRWREVVAVLALAASESLYNVLLFVNGGWMVDQRTDGTVDENRQHQMSHLRKICIPHVARLLQDVLHTQGRYQKALQLADIVSSERYQLYKEFTTEDLKQFIKAALDSSFSLLDRNMDPLGYESQ